jgi:hypothetical protein
MERAATMDPGLAEDFVDYGTWVAGKVAPSCR